MYASNPWVDAWQKKNPGKTPPAPKQPAAAAPVAWTPQQLAALGSAYAQKNPGWAPAAGTAPGVNVHPGSTGTKTPPVPPYMTGPDIINYGSAYKDKGDQLAQSDKDLGDVKAWAQTAIYNIGRNYLQGTDNTQNDAAARGIFQSSIKDGALADLAATKATLSSDVNTRVGNAQVFHDAAVKRINDWFDNFTEGMNTIKVDNGAAAGANSPPYLPGQEPTSSTFSVPATSTGNPWVDAWLKQNPGKTWPS